MNTTLRLEAEAVRVRGITSVGFDWTMMALCLWLQGGVYLDAWAHLHIPGMATFFNPWHAVLYSGVMAAGALAAWPERLAGRPRPDGYGLSLAGAVIFLGGGFFDMLWHLAFGIESDLEALFSPTHIVLGLGATLIITGPLRAAWQPLRRGDTGWAKQGPMVISLGLLLSSLSFWTQYLHPFNRPWAALGNKPTTQVFPVAAPDPLILGGGIPSLYIAQASGMSSIVLQTAITMGVMLWALRRFGWTLPTGTFTVVFTLNAVMMGVLKDQFALIPFALVAGIDADVLLAYLRPSPARIRALRAFAFTVPAVYFILYLATIAVVKGLWWSTHLVTGTIMLAGMTGLLISYLVAPGSEWRHDDNGHPAA